MLSYIKSSVHNHYAPNQFHTIYALPPSITALAKYEATLESPYGEAASAKVNAPEPLVVST